ncbi:MAG: N-acetylmuramoyl-L-alanine amidase, partial [Acidobacteriota bacterium]|nr:N-acetylmuramoyl-L-alanine amidase [Acidobacteriota bacterium]
MTYRLTLAACLLLLATEPGGSQTLDEPLTLISSEGRRLLPTVAFDGRRMVDLRQLTGPFGLTVPENQQPGRLTVLRGEQVIVLTANQGLVSVAGTLVSLPSPPVQRSGFWYVPIDFIGRVLALVHDQSVELRRRSGLVVIGDIRVPQVVARYQRIGPQSRLRLMITPAANHVIEQETGRLVITFAADALDLVLPDIAPDTLVRSLRGVATRPALAVDLGNAFGAYTSRSEPAIGGGVELVVDLQPTPATSTRVVPPPASRVPTPADAAPDPDLPTLSDVAPPRTIRARAIDPGHGGNDTGTRGPNGTLEKEVTLAVARRLRNLIESQLGLRVVLTRTTDTTVALDERAAIANNNRADLFISLHTNASVRESATGAEVFYLSLAEYDAEAREASGFTGQPVPVVGGGSRVLDIVPWELAPRRPEDQSARGALTVADALSLRLPMSPPGRPPAPGRVVGGA